MKDEQYTPSILDFAYEVIDMNRKIIILKRDLAHANEMIEIYQEGAKRSEQHGANMFGIMLNGILDSESSINKGGRAIAELELQKAEKEV